MKRFRAQSQAIGDKLDILLADVEKEGATQRNISRALELYALQNDLYLDIADAARAGEIEDSLLVRVDGKAVKFKNINEVAEWMSNGLE